MMTVSEVSRITGVSIRALHHYDSIGLLPPARVTEAGYRLYDDKALEQLQLILLFRELEFPLKEIAAILNDPQFDRAKALDQQIRLLELRRERLNDLIGLARGIKKIGVQKMSKISFEAFDTRKIDEYAKQAKESWGKTDAYREFEQKSAGRGKDEENMLGVQMMDIFAELGKLRGSDPAGTEARTLIVRLQSFITEHYYTCTDAILEGLGQMYAGGGEMTANIDRCGGEGTAAFANEAIEAYILSK